MTDKLAVAAQRIAQLEAEIAEQRKLNEMMSKSNQKSITLRVADKGGVSVYGLGRFPITLYSKPKDGSSSKGQWERLFAAKDEILAFIAANDSLITERLSAARGATNEPAVASPPAHAQTAQSTMTKAAPVTVKRFTGRGDAL